MKFEQAPQNSGLGEHFLSNQTPHWEKGQQRFMEIQPKTIKTVTQNGGRT